MVKAKKGNALIIGLSDENIRRLKNDQPIKFNMADVGFPAIEVFIFSAKDEQTMYEMMKKDINPLTTIIKDDNAPNN
jgi:hypothetical protein